MSDARDGHRLLSAARIADELGLPHPTPQQIDVIEAPLAPAIVVAGAGSGKTETMANRVVWLLANNLVQVPEVLGLTFTRKAARELSARIRLRVEQLTASGLADVSLDAFDAVGVSTYNAFASSIYRENALLIGREPDATLLGEAAAWQLARALVVASDDERLVQFTQNVDAITEAVVALSREMGENLASAERVAAMAERFGSIAALPGGGKNGPTIKVSDAVKAVAPLPALVDLAQNFDAEKVRRGLIEFSDQVALALRILERVPRVAAEIRGRFPVVLLDEYQDTSVVQTRLLSTLFRSRAVMAVGDPHQSIYGWRGASASNLSRFGQDFGDAESLRGDAEPWRDDAEPASTPDPGRGSVSRFALSTSWRNPTRVLEAANVIAAPLRARSPIAVETLQPRPGAGEGALSVVWRQNVLDEADAVAVWFAEQVRRDDREGVPSAAMLCRTIRHIRPFTDALTRHGVDYHVLGIGGLLDEPVVADLVAALRVLHNPTAGPELLRVLTGARWRIGVRDIRALRETASWIARHDHAQKVLEPSVVEALRHSVVDDDQASIVDALDFVTTAPAGHRALEGFSAEGLQRLRQAGAELASLRTRVGFDLVDLVVFVSHQLLLDIEAAANDTARHGTASLDEFIEQVAAFAEFDERASLGSFLSWLAEAERRDRLSPHSDEPEPGTVQILTVHGAKGLEWDLVAIPRAVTDELPAKPQTTRGWLTFGALPYEFRGDAAELPVLAWRTATTQREFGDAMSAFQAEVAARHADEERRLCYVALTRARRAVLLSGSWWASQTRPRSPSVLITELQTANVLPRTAVPDCDDPDENPLSDQLVRVLWPLDPLGVRESRVRAAARAVDAARTSGEVAPSSASSSILERLARTGQWRDDLRVLLAERDRRDDDVVEIPVRIAASRFKDYIDDPASVVRSLRRPMPERPYRQTRLGTRFHSWVEERGRAQTGDDLVDASTDIDALPEEFDLEPDAAAIDFVDAGLGSHVDDGAAGHPDTPHEADDDARLRALVATFERSEWGARRPERVELEIHTVLAERVIVCKLDAVYAAVDGVHTHQIVDWKTGRPPRDEEDLRSKQFQLALYRLAYSRWAGIPADQIDAVFYYVADDLVIRPERLYSEGELRAAWSSATGRMPPP